MATPLEIQDCLERLSPIFHQEVRGFYQSVQSQGEQLFAIANSSARGFSENSSGGYLGFLAITSRRIVLANYQANRRRPTARYYQAGEGFFYQIVIDPTLLGSSPEPLSAAELESRIVQEAPLTMLIDVELGAHFGTMEEQTFRALELNFKGSGRGPDGWMGSLGVWRALLDESSGRAIYQLLQDAIQGGAGTIGSTVSQNAESGQPTVSRDEMLLRLERLAALYEKGMLTEDEFKAGKAKLLGL